MKFYFTFKKDFNLTPVLGLSRCHTLVPQNLSQYNFSINFPPKAMKKSTTKKLDISNNKKTDLSGIEHYLKKFDRIKKDSSL